MRADARGTHAEQVRSEIGWVSPGFSGARRKLDPSDPEHIPPTASCDTCRDHYWAMDRGRTGHDRCTVRVRQGSGEIATLANAWCPLWRQYVAPLAEA
jgi:hypothetical protein